eukprot:g26068.t1
MITDNLSWTSHISATVKTAQQHLFFLRRVQEIWHVHKVPHQLLQMHHKDILSWYGNCSAQDSKKLQMVVCTAQNITEANLPSMNSIYMAYCHRKAANIIKDPSHP